jgi:transposase
MKRIFTSDLSDTRAERIFRAIRFGARTQCIDCGYTRKLWRLSDGRWECKRCGKQFGLLTATALARTRFSLVEVYELLSWFELELTDHAIARRVGLPYHQVHRFFLNVRQAIAAYEERSITLLDGEVEVDESYFGPRFRNRRHRTRQRLKKSGMVKRGRGSKRLQTVVFGIYERPDGIVYTQPVPDVSSEVLKAIIHEKVSIETTVYSDTLVSYHGLGRRYADHQTLRHREGEYVRGAASINGIEGFWAYAKERLLRPHGVSANHFLLYLKEVEYRFNHRHLQPEEFVHHLTHVLLS